MIRSGSVIFNESRDPVQHEMEQDKLISRAKLAHEQQRFNPDMVILADVNAQPSHISKPLMQRIEYFSSLAGQRLIPAIYVRRLSHVWNDWSMYATASYLHLFVLWQAM